jgi:hypothetical protein
MRILFKNLLLDKFIMSRRTAPTAGKQQQQQRTPQPSIRSSQAFAPQPTREQTQYQQTNSKKQLQQQQLQQQQQTRNYQSEYKEVNEREQQVGNTTKITILQAITLITLRLGSIETKIMNGEFGLRNNVDNNIDEETLSNVSNRLDALETKINLSSSTDNKQQIEHLTQALIQHKNISNILIKENKDLKTQMINFKKEMSDIKELIESVKNISTSNENKILQMLNVQCDFQMEEGIEITNENELNLSDSENSILETDIRQSLSVTEYEDDDEELDMTNISEIEEQN